jgi:hypothetical protein
MLPLSVVQEIDRLLGEGNLSHRKIAERLGVSRATVSAMATGKRGVHGKVPLPGGPNERCPHARPERCPRCGFRVYMPCLVCRTRAYRRDQHLHRLVESAGRESTLRGRRRRPARRRQRPCRSAGLAAGRARVA